MFCRSVFLQSRRFFLNGSIRTFLSKEYKCVPEWETRLSSPIVQKVNLNNLFYEIDQAFNQEGKANAIDIDIFVNKVTDENHVDEMADLMYRLRATEETSNCLESSGHALIRILIDHNRFDDLIEILDDSLGYGVFLDHYLASYAMSDCIKQDKFHYAARIATFLMLQEDFENELSRNLSLYSCYKYLLTDPKPFYPIEEKKGEEPKEEIKVRVKYVRNEFFDDHFDLRNHKHLVGKTLMMIGNEMNDTIGKNVKLLGEILYQKYDTAIKTFQTMEEKILYKDILKNCLKFIEEDSNYREKNIEVYDKVHAKLKEIFNNKNFNKNDFNIVIEKLVKDSVEKNEKIEIEKQKNIYEKWNELRDQKFYDELNRLHRAQRLKQIEKLTKEIKDEEQKLWFFENEEKIDLLIDNEKFHSKQFDKKKDQKITDEEYIPPEIIKQRK